MQQIKLLLLFLIFGSTAKAQLDSVFVRNYGGPDNEPLGFGAGFAGAPHVRSAIDENGNVYLASFTVSTSGDIPSNQGLDDVFVVKTSSDGSILWSQTYGGESTERCYSIKVLTNGNIVITGRTASTQGIFNGALGLEDGFILILNPENGEIVSLWRFGGSQPETIYDVLELDNGDLIACGISGSIDGDINDATYAGSSKAWVFRVNPSGEIIWSRITNGLIINPDWEESFWNISLNNQKDAIYLLGASYNFNDINSDDLLVCKYSLSGDLLLKQTFGGNAGDSPADLWVNSNNEVFAFSTIRGSGGDVSQYFAGNADAWLVKLDSNLNFIWDKSYGGTNLDYGYGLSSYTEESLILSLGSRSVDETANRAGYGLMDGLLIEISTSNGDTIQTLRWGSSGNDYAHDVAIVSEGEFYSIGRSDGTDGWISGAKGGSDLVLVHYRDLQLQLSSLAEQSNPFVYPNPSSDFFYLNVNDDVILNLYNTQGKLVGTMNSSTSKVFDISSLSSGVYLLEAVSNEGAIKHQKVIISK